MSAPASAAVVPPFSKGQEKRLLALLGAVFGHKAFAAVPYSNDRPLKQAAASPLPFVALLLFSAPEGLTIRTLLAFHGLGLRSHQ